MVSGNIRSVLLHLRLPFSLFLLPIFLFALSQAPAINNQKAILVFFILHLFIYPASNAYNSYFDKDQGSIALLKTPPQVNKSLFETAVILEWAGVALALLVNIEFAIAMIVYNSFSKAYSHPKIRIKKYPVLSFLVIFIFQGFFIYYACYKGVSSNSGQFSIAIFIAGMICSCLIGASYPLTQIYQHEEDTKRGDKTLSILLGIPGSFVFSAIVFSAGFFLLYYYWGTQHQLFKFYVFIAFAIPLILYFLWWFYQCMKDGKNASYENTMRMTLLSASLMLIYFGWLFFIS
ncbi:ubiquinone biosynthesis protein UbiA [Pedobacter antarcticus 4BY]|uniref:Ubiquinone biosynthesis protein UbiA n=2 Tax=Pedobacter antarcticus TaxID=34086 RepID=A0A081PJU0_9SPHI|nr:UbiA family prenyltransferase [Pedobacter antarcticus]KEQ30963.1 ubiquinone biosynthesis protein UbiA [Pedobacter antarcticus 4BY]SFF21986.1 1,4-dihydroxy-2-naphthoate octaprenyltransferase [Pedobacter antarcticus]